MPNFLVLGIYFLLFSDDDEMVGWNWFFHGGSVEDADNNYGVGILTDLTTWRLLFPMATWNNFLRSFHRFIVVRSGHDEGLRRINFRSVFLILRWQKEEERHQKEEVSQIRLHECWPSLVGHLSSGFLTSVCLCSHHILQSVV